MTTITYPNSSFLYPPVVAGTISKYALPELLSFDLIMTEDIGDAKSVSFIDEKYAASNDPKKLDELANFQITEASLFPYVKFSALESKSATLKTYGLAMEFSDEVMRNTQLVNFMKRGMMRAAYWLAAALNEAIFTEITNSWSTSASTEDNTEPWNVAATAVWSDTSTRVPYTDFKNVKALVEDTELYAYDLEKAYFRKDNEAELEDYLQINGNTNWARDPVTNDWNGMFKGIQTKGVHKLSGIPASTGLFLSRNSKPCTLYTAKNPNFPAASMVDETGQPLFGGMPLHVYSFFKPEDHTTHVQLWFEAHPRSDKWDRKSVCILRTL